jgi:CRP-like cAMP-binding protein
MCFSTHRLKLPNFATYCLDFVPVDPLPFIKTTTIFLSRVRRRLDLSTGRRNGQKVVAFRCGRKFIIGIVQAGQFIGEAVLGGLAIRLTTFRVMENSQLISISLSTMQRSLRSCPGLADLFTTYLLRKTRRIEADFVDQILNLAQKRLARTLLILSNLQNNTGLTSTPIHFDQTTIARMVGCNRSRFNLFMNRFRKLGFISYSNRSFTALQENRLRSFVAGVRGVLSYA